MFQRISNWLGRRIDRRVFGELLHLAAPLALSQLSFVVMQITDGLFLSRYSPAAIAAVGPAGMTVHLLSCLFTAAVGYTVALVAQYTGAGLYAEWTIATVFVIALGLMWFFRFRSGAWREIRVIEEKPAPA